MEEETTQAENSSISQTTLVILLGASEFPNSSYESHRQQEQKKKLLASAVAIKEYFVKEFKVPENNLCDLFDSPNNSHAIFDQIRNFLKARVQEAQNVLVYYVGHGNNAIVDNDLYLAIKDTDKDEIISSISVRTLATIIKEYARHLRRIYIFDCCFAGLATIPFINVLGRNQLLTAVTKKTEPLYTLLSLCARWFSTSANRRSIQRSLLAAEQSQGQGQNQNEGLQAGGVLLFCSSGPRQLS